jgi:hypothetical protein
MIIRINLMEAEKAEDGYTTDKTTLPEAEEPSISQDVKDPTQATAISFVSN